MNDKSKIEAKERGSTKEVAQRPGRFIAPFEDMERMMEGFFPHGWLHPFRREWPDWASSLTPFEGKMPRVDVIDKEESVVVRAEVPGVKKDDLDISLSDNTVTIRGSLKHEEETKEGQYIRREMSRGEFSRTLTLPADVDASKAKATFSDGVLELTLPKQEPSRRHKIKVN
ncbi:MAG: HSP20 family protein [Gammaproteobacteria bacterium]|nr:MAG: HSP20 family protein [Gammaproteobacteria bacterium]TND06890.1 MAG: HSP20 family protein [Gammaproteobacteria bacterium]